MEGFILAVLVGNWLVSAVAGAVIGEHRGRIGRGFALGLLLGPLGVVAAATMPPSAAALVEEERQRAKAREGAALDRLHEKRRGSGSE